VDESFVPCRVPDKKQEVCYWYGYQWWVGEHKGVQFQCARGMLGQYIIMIPETQMVVVRLGHKQDKERIRHMPMDLYEYIDAACEIALQN
jgi:CubicO group peptidase (beta-lactamase class C family)